MPSRMARLMMALLLVFLSLMSTRKAHADMYGAQGSVDSPYDLLDAVNALRATYGLAPYSVNSILMAAAQGHADYMAATGDVSHTGLGGSSVTDRLLSLGYPLGGDLSLGGFKSENITSGREGMTAQEAVNRWTGDTLHLTTMISAELTEIGAGVTVNGGRVYFVIDAARPTDNGIPQAPRTPVAGGPTTIPGMSGVIIPVVVVTPNENGDIIHEVKAGQSLWQIAISYGTRIDEIKRLNTLFNDNIYPGTQLLIRKGVATVIPISATSPSEPVASPALESAFAAVPVTPSETMAASEPVTYSAGSTIGIAAGIIVLAILGGGLIAWWGAKKKE